MAAEAAVVTVHQKLLIDALRQGEPMFLNGHWPACGEVCFEHATSEFDQGKNLLYSLYSQ